MQTDKMEMCHRCTSDASYFIKNGDIEVHFCYGCGFTATNQETKEELLPELYKDLKYVDKETGLIYYPSTINIPTKGMVFAEGSSVRDWKWAAVCGMPIPKKDLKKFPEGQTHKMDMSTIQYFEERDFMDALSYIEYFDID